MDKDKTELLNLAAELIEKMCDEDDLIECLSFNHPQLSADILKWHEEYERAVINGQ